MWRLIPDANFSRNVNFHVVKDHEGVQRWVGRYTNDLLQYVALIHENGLLVDLDGEEYLVRVTPAPRRPPHG
jgi:hypothetical protein